MMRVIWPTVLLKKVTCSMVMSAGSSICTTRSVVVSSIMSPCVVLVDKLKLSVYSIVFGFLIPSIYSSMTPLLTVIPGEGIVN